MTATFGLFSKLTSLGNLLVRSPGSLDILFGPNTTPSMQGIPIRCFCTSHLIYGYSTPSPCRSQSTTNAGHSSHTIHERLSTLLLRDLSSCDARAIREHSEEIDACINLVNIYKRLLTCDLAPAPQAPRPAGAISSGHIPAREVQAEPIPAPPAPPAQLPRSTPPAFNAAGQSSVTHQHYNHDGRETASTPHSLTRPQDSLTRGQMTPPPIATFPTERELRDYCESWALAHGYDLVKHGGRGSSYSQAWRYECGCYGKTQNNRKLAEEFRRRVRPSRECGCKFFIYIVRQESDSLFEEEDTWTIEYPRKPYMHNHDPIQPETAIGKNRRKARVENGAA